MLRSVLVIVAKDLRQRSRDRSILIMGLLAPLGLVLILDATIGGGDAAPALRLGLVSDGQGELGPAFDDMFDGLVAEGVIDGRRLDSRAALERLVDGGELQAGFVVEPDSIVVVGDPGAPLAVEVAEAIASSFALEVEHQAVVATLAAGRGQGEEPSLDGAAAAAPAPVRLVTATTGASGYDAGTYLAVSMSVFFLFFTVQFGVLSLLGERDTGTLGRLLAAPIRPASLLIGKVLSSLATGVVTMAVLVLATSLISGADWGEPLAVAVLVLTGVIVATSLALLVSGLASSAEQAGAYTSIVAIVSGLLGGAFVPVGGGSGLLHWLTYLSPHRWLYVAFRQVSHGASLGDLMGELAVLALFTVLAGGIGLRSASRQLVPR